MKGVKTVLDFETVERASRTEIPSFQLAFRISPQEKILIEHLQAFLDASLVRTRRFQTK